MRRSRVSGVLASLAVVLLASAAFGQVPLTEPPLPVGDEGRNPAVVSDNFAESAKGVTRQFLPLPPKPNGPVAPAARQPQGMLSERIVYTSGGHGWTADTSGTWYTQRGNNNNVVEDLGNLDQMTMYANYCFNSGATVVPFRPVGYQTNEVVLDNDDASVQFFGTWTDSTATVFYGTAGDVPYRYTNKSATETAFARYTPNIPQAGFYPVYCWTRDGSDRLSDQLYRIRSTGGASEVRINHRRVGKGWIYLGTYYFDQGSSTAAGCVEISNQSSDAVGTIAIADAIRFGNGMGDINRGAGVSGYSREDEASRYWIQRALGQGSPSTIYEGTGDDASDNVGAPARMAAQMNRELEGATTERVYMGFHSNAGTGTSRGGDGLWNNDTLFPGTKTPNQYRWAELVGRAVNDELLAVGSPPLEYAWTTRAAGAANVTFYRTDYAFGEIREDTINGEMDATIIEVAFHDNTSDAAILRDPKARDWIARASYHATARYFNEFSTLTLALLPEPPTNVRVVSNGTGGAIVSWNAPPSGIPSGDAATGYVVYRSTNGYGFGNPVTVSGGSTLSTTITGLPANDVTYFRVAATNAGGESMPSETLGVRPRPAGAPPVLVVNGFDRLDRKINPRETQGPGIGGTAGGSSTFDRVKPRKSNSFDYVVQHAKALHNCGRHFDSCSNEAVTAGQVTLGSYKCVVWILGQESTTDKTFSAAEQSLVQAYLAAGGNLFVTGSEIGWDLDQSNNGRTFYENTLSTNYVGDDAATYQVQGSAGIFASLGSFDFNPSNGAPYDTAYPDQIAPLGSASTNLTYVGGSGGNAGIQFSNGTYKVVNFGFPFEAITSESARTNIMNAVMNYFGAGLPVGLSGWEIM